MARRWAPRSTATPEAASPAPPGERLRENSWPRGWVTSRLMTSTGSGGRCCVWGQLFLGPAAHQGVLSHVSEPPSRCWGMGPCGLAGWGLSGGGVRPAERSEPGRQSERPSRRHPPCWPRARPGTRLRAFRGSPRSHRHNPACLCLPPLRLPLYPSRPPPTPALGPFLLGRLLTFTHGSWPSCSGDGQLCLPAWPPPPRHPPSELRGRRGPGSLVGSQPQKNPESGGF